MKNFLLLALAWGLCLTTAQAQLFVEQFDGDASALQGGAAFSFNVDDGELTVTADGSSGTYDAFTYVLPAVSDASGNNKVFVRAKASTIGTQFRLDLQDVNDYATTQAGITKTLTTDFMVLEFDWTANLDDAAYGGTGCTDGPCPVDASMIKNLVMFIDPASGGFAGDVVIDYIAFGEEPMTDITSDVFQDHFDNDSVLTSFTLIPDGMTLTRDGSQVTLTGDGTHGMWDPVTYVIRNQTTFEEIDLDMTQGDNKLYVRMKSTVPGTSLRIDFQDIDNFITTNAPVTKILTDEFVTYEYDLTGLYQDGGYGGTSCTADTAPCPVDPTRIRGLIMFIEPGVGGFAGEITMEYMSVGTALEPAGPAAEQIYTDHFDDEDNRFAGSSDGSLTVTETGTELTISADGTSGPYVATGYTFHEDTTAIVLDFGPANNRVFIKGRMGSGSAKVRVDIADSTGLNSSFSSLSKNFTDEDTVYEFDFTGAQDGGYGGTPCDAANAPCLLDLSIVQSLVIFIEPDNGGYQGELILDYISVGQPLGDGPPPVPTGIVDYQDNFDGDATFVSGGNGVTSTVANGEWTVTADGTSSPYSVFQYFVNADGDNALADAVASNNTVYVRAKATAPVGLRLDLKDNEGFATTLAGLNQQVGTEYSVLAYNYAGQYNDGGYGGTSCTAGPCPVDGERVANLDLYLDPDDGGYAGTVTIDWISFGQDLTTGVVELPTVNTLAIFPNPATDRLLLNYELAQAGRVGYRLFDARGTLLHQAPERADAAGNHNRAVDLRNRAAGTYFVQLIVDGRYGTAVPFIKQ